LTGGNRNDITQLLSQARSEARIARRGQEHGSGLSKERWVVERTFAWLHNLRRLEDAL
jgi:transposase